jgi:hypothetical protein
MAGRHLTIKKEKTALCGTENTDDEIQKTI